MVKYVVLLICVLSLGLLLNVSASALPTADEVLKMMAESQSKVQSMESDTVSVVNAGAGQVNSTGHTINLWIQEDGKTIQKFLSTTKSTVQAGDKILTYENKAISDGHFMWLEMRVSMPPTVRVIKTNADATGASQSGTPAERLEQLKEQFTFGDVGEDTIDGRKMYVLSGTLKEDRPDVQKKIMSTMKYFVDQENLNVRRMVSSDPQGKEVMCTDTTNVKINGTIDPRIFDYTPPADAQVQDMTRQPATRPAPQGNGQ